MGELAETALTELRRRTVTRGLCRRLWNFLIKSGFIIALISGLSLRKYFKEKSVYGEKCTLEKQLATGLSSNY